MKTYVMAACLLVLCACGGGGTSSSPVSSTQSVLPETSAHSLTWTGETVWEGYIDEDPELLEVYNETRECLGDLAIAAEVPYLIVITGVIHHADYPESEWAAYCDLFERQIIINEANYEGVYRHEFVHWLTWRDDSIHDEPFMAECTMIF